jgi:hypothetical protein
MIPGDHNLMLDGEGKSFVIIIERFKKINPPVLPEVMTERRILRPDP